MMISRYEGVKDQELAVMVTRQRGEDFLVDTSPQVEICVCVCVASSLQDDVLSSSRAILSICVHRSSLLPSLI